MDIQTAIKTVISGQDLGSDDMAEVMRLIMTGECTGSQIGGFLVGRTEIDVGRCSVA